MLDNKESPRGGFDISVRPSLGHQGWMQVFPSETQDKSILYVREQGLKLLAAYTSPVRGFNVPRTRREGENLLVEEARGIRLQELYSPNSAEFYRIPTRVKLNALEIYLSAIVAINTNGEMVHDHNPDGIFVDYNTESGDVDVWLVDPGDVGKGNETTQQLAFSGEGQRTGLLDLARHFFTRDHEDDCIPPSLRGIDDSKSMKSIDFLKLVRIAKRDDLTRPERYRRILLTYYSGVESVVAEKELTYADWQYERTELMNQFLRLVRDKKITEARNILLKSFKRGHELSAIIDPNFGEEVNDWKHFTMRSDEPDIMPYVGRVQHQEIDRPRTSTIKSSRDFFLTLLKYISQIPNDSILSETRKVVYNTEPS